jgi:hypothetical protein
MNVRVQYFTQFERRGNTYSELESLETRVLAVGNILAMGDGDEMSQVRGRNNV